MVKRIFAIIGIVLGSVTVFAGAVFGVLALLGKFKTPVVYPTVLSFEHEEIMVLEKVPFDTSDNALDFGEQNASIYSFKLIGSNPDEKHAVNQKDCYLWFVDSEDAKLITLCEKNGKPLEAVNNRYEVECNELIYFMINDIGEELTDGVVELMARSVNDTLKKPENTLKIYIDRKVQAVYVNDADQPKTPEMEEGKLNNQEIRKGIGIDVDFNFNFITPLSKQPIATASPKDVEIYYDASGKADGETDYVRVTEEAVSTSPILQPFMKFEEGKFKINSQVSGIHNFILATFPTYESKLAYEALNAEHTNYERVHSGYMLLTELKVVFEDVEITEIGFTKQSVALGLYSEKDYITLNMDNVISDAKNCNNLGLYMKKGTNPSYSDFTRFDGVNLNGFNGEIWASQNSNINFTTSTLVNYSFTGNNSVELNEGEYQLVFDLDGDEETQEDKITFTIVKSNLYFADNLVVIDHLIVGEATNVKYYCSNGAAVLNLTTNKLQLLRTGTYLNFFSEKIVDAGEETEHYEFKFADQRDFEREITYVEGTYGIGRTWNVVPKSLFNVEGANLVMGVLAVNSKGDFDVNSFFKTIDVTVSADPWVYEQSEQVQANIGFTQQGTMFNESAILFEEIIPTKEAGSYNQGVLLVEEQYREKVETVDLYFEYGTGNEAKKYYVVGKMVTSNDENNFINIVQPKEGIAQADEIELFLLKLKHGYSETAEDLISKMLQEVEKETSPSPETPPETEPSLELSSEQTPTVDKNKISSQYVLNGNDLIKVSTFTARYVINSNLLTISYVKTVGEGEEATDVAIDLNKIYEKTTGYKIVITSTNETMLKTLFNFYGTNTTGLTEDLEYQADYITIRSIELANEDKDLVVVFDAGNKLNLTQESTQIKLNNFGGTITFDEMKIVDGSPSVIILNAKKDAGDSERFALAGNEQTANSSNYIKVVVSYNNEINNYVYTYYLVKGETETKIDTTEGKTFFNKQISDAKDSGFQGEKEGVFAYNVEYLSLNDEIFSISADATAVDILKMGTLVLKVKIGSTEGFVKLLIENDGNFAMTTLNNLKVFETKLTNGKFISFDEDEKPLYRLTYNKDENTTVDITANNVQIKNVKSLVYGDGSLVAIPNGEANPTQWILKKSKDDESNILELSLGADGWTFTKSHAHIPLQIEMTIVAKVCDETEICAEKTITLSFVSNVSVALNYPWNGNSTLYNGTKIQLSSTEHALFNVVDENTTKGTFSFVPNGENASVLEDVLSLKNCGALTITVQYNGAKIQDFEFNVKPNVVVVGANELTSLSEYEIADIYSLKEFKTKNEDTSDLVYGSTSTAQFYVREYYTDATFTQKSETETDYSKWEFSPNNPNLTDFSNTADISILIDEKSNLSALSFDNINKKLTVGHISVLGGEESIKLSLVGGDDLIDKERKIIVKNTFQVQEVNSGEESKNEELIFDCLKEYVAFVKVKDNDNYKIRTVNVVKFNAVSGEYEPLLEYVFDWAHHTPTQPGTESYGTFKFEGINDNGTIIPILEEKEVELRIIYCLRNCDEFGVCSSDCNMLTHIASVTLRPYTPKAKEIEDVAPAYSGTEYDLLKDLYVVQYDSEQSDYRISINADKNIKKLMVTGILDENGNDFSSEVVTSFTPNGFESGVAGANCQVTFKEIVGQKRTVYVQFTVTYAGANMADKTYSYLKELTIFNRLALSSAVYPEQGYKASNVAFNFFENYNADAVEISGEENAQLGCLLNVESYETMLVYTDEQTKINFKNDATKTVSRFMVADNVNPENKNHDLKIELIAYQNDGNLPYSVVEKVAKFGTNEIIINPLGATFESVAGMLIFKVSTVSGNYKYYYVRIYCKGAKNAIKTDNNLDVVAFNSVAGTFVEEPTEQSQYCKVEINESTSYLDLINSSIVQAKFSSKFGIDYKDSTTKLYLYNGVATGGDFVFNVDESDNSKQWKELVGTDKIVQGDLINTIIIGLLYDNGYEKYTYGTITIYVQPKDTEIGLSCTVDTGTEGTINLTYDKPNGEFAAVLNSNTRLVMFTGWEASVESIDDMTYVTEGNTITYSGSTINFGARVLNDKIIRAKYTKNNTIIYVTYTLKATILPTVESTEQPINVGNFVEKTGFDNEVNLSSDKDSSDNLIYFGSYNGDFTVSVEGWSENDIATGKEFTLNENKFIYNSATKTLIFTQTTERWLANVTITYSTIEGTPTRTWTFIVEPGIKVVTNYDSGSGSNRENRYTTDVIDGYQNVNGSQLEFAYKYSNDYAEWSIGNMGKNALEEIVWGLVIYTSTGSKLQLSFDNKLYVLGDKEEANPSNKSSMNITSAEHEETCFVYFPHLAKETALDVGISIAESTNNKIYATTNLYLNVAKTYGGLKAEYLTDGNHENVKNGEKIEDLYSTFAGKIPVKLILLDKSGIEVEKAEFSLETMGFTTKGNPNHLNFACFANGMVKEFGENSKTVGIQFDEVSQNTNCNLIISNNSGMIGVTYSYQIMAGDYVDGMNFNTTDGIYVNDSEAQYISFMTSEKKNFIIGKTFDMKNTQSGENAVFDVSVHSAELQHTRTINNGKYQGTTEDSVSGIQNGTEKRFTKNATSYYVILNFDTGNVELYIPAKGIDNELTLTIGGVNGSEAETAMIYELMIHLEANTVTSNYDDLSKYVFANDKIQLKDVTNSENANFTFGFKSAKYSVAGQAKEVYQADNNLFIVSDDLTNNPTIKFNAVGEDIDATLNFQVFSNNYLITEIKIKFLIQLNLQIVVNAGELKDNIGSTSMETNFVLSTKQNANIIPNSSTQQLTFAIKINFKHITDLVDMSNFNNGFSDILVYDLYYRHSQEIENASDEELRTGAQNIKVSFKGNRAYDGVELDEANKCLTFNKDFSGELELVLSVVTANGTYSVDWTIHVTPVLDLKYANANPETAKLLEGSLPFLSNSKVSIINQSSRTGVGVTMQTPSEFESEFQKVSDAAAIAIGGNPKVSYSYKIIDKTDTSGVSNKILFTSENYKSLASSAKKTITLLKTNNENTLSVELTLPSVKATTSEQAKSYYVIYEIYVEYLGLKHAGNLVKVFYVAYDVINYQNVETYTYEIPDGNDGTKTIQSANIDVSTDLVDSKNLTLFNYSETYTVGEDKYKFTYDGTDIKMAKTTNNSTTTINQDSQSQGKFGSIYYDISEHTLFTINGNEKTEIVGGTWSQETRSVSGNVHSVFDSMFSNIFEYQKLIDLYFSKDTTLKSIQLNYTKNNTPCSLSFALIVLSNGGFGIDLTDGGTFNSINPLFNNELKAEFALVYQGIKTISIDAYSDKFKAGFIFRTSNSITPMSSKSLREMKLSQYLQSNSNGITPQTQIVGIGSERKLLWFEQTNLEFDDRDMNLGILSIGNNNGTNKTYSICLFGVNSKSVDSSAFYTISQDYYYIKTAENENFVTYLDYSAVSVETDRFKVLAPAGATAELNVANAIKAWKTDENGRLVEELVSGYTVTETDDQFEVVDNIVKMNVLQYKIENPEKSQYSGTITIAANSVVLTANVSFELPSTYYTSQIEVSVGETVIELSGIVKKYAFNLEGSIEETNLEDFSVSSTDQNLTIDRTRVTFDASKFTESTYLATVTIKVDARNSYNLKLVFTQQ